MPDSTAIQVRSGAVGVSGETRADARAVRRLPGGEASSILVWSWFMVVVGALMALKLVMIVGQGEGLYETHWRVGGLRVTWLNVAAFYLFIFLGGLGLVRLGKECQGAGVRTVRIVNAVVLGLGLSFIFLTLHNGDKNYLYPILTGVLTWSSLGPYVANSLFFNEPFLAGWIFVYAAIYYVLARTGRERWVLFLTTGFAVAYALIFFQEQIVHGNELLIADCVGAVSVLMAWRRRSRANSSRLSSWGLICPLSWTFFFGWVLLRYDDSWHSNSAKYILGLMGGTLCFFATASWLVRKAGNPAAWSWLLPFLVAGFFLLTDSNYPLSSNYTHLICLAATFPRYATVDIILALLVAAGALLYRKWRPGASLWWLNFAGLGVIIIAGLDLRLTQIMGVRLGWDVLSFGDSPTMMLKMARPYLAGVIVGVVAIIGVYTLAIRSARAWLVRLSSGKSGSEAVSVMTDLWRRPGVTYVAALVIGLGVLGLNIAGKDKAEDQTILRLVRTSPLWKRVASRPMSRENFLNSAAALGLGNFRTPASTSAWHERRDLNVLVVFMESSYNKHLSLFGSSEDTQPLLSKYKDRMEIFPNFFSAFTGSIQARFATFTSLYPVMDFHTFTQDRVAVKSLFEVFHDQGYTCSMFYSSHFDYTGFGDFLKNRGLDEMYDADTMPGQRGTERVAWGLLEEETLGAIRGQLKKYAQNHQRFCLTYVPAAPHYPYDKIPKPFQKHKLEEIGDFTPLYLNELLYIDWVVASIVDQLKESGLLDNTLVVITNDHGEMLGGKDGHIGHGWAVTPQLQNTPLILMDPGRPGFQINKTIGTQVDLLPTILDRLHIPIPPEELYEGLSLDAGPARAQRLGYINSYKEFGIVSGEQILLGDRESSSPTGAASKGAAFAISNDGAKSLFSEVGGSETNQPEPSVGSETLTNAQPKTVLSVDANASADSITMPLMDIEARETLMKRFDSFQESLLRNYAYYSKELRRSDSVKTTDEHR